MKKTGFNGYVYDFSVDYDAIAIDDILDIHKYLMKKNNIIWYDTCLKDTSCKQRIKMFGFIEKIFLTGLTVLSHLNPLSATPLSCISMNNQACKIRPEIVNVNSDEPEFYPFSVKKSKCSGSCNNINDRYAKMCVPDVVKNLNVKVFNLMSVTNETRHMKWHKKCKCKSRLDAGVCNNKQWWNEDKCWCECKELIDKGVCEKEYIWNHSNCECECDKSCDVGEYLDYEDCKYRKKLADKLVFLINKFFHSVHYVVFNILRNQLENWCLFFLLQIHES